MNADEKWLEARELLNKAQSEEEFQKAVTLIQEAADENNIDAIVTLAQLHFYGKGVEHDANKAVEMLTKAADMGSPVSPLILANIYHEGDGGIEKDLDKARQWLEKFCQYGSPESHYRLGRCYLEGDMYEQDFAKALEELTIAVKEGFHEASPFYIQMLWEGQNAEMNKEAVIATYTELAEKGDAVAYYYLYLFNTDENYADADKEKALEYLKKSAEIGFPNALNDLGALYLSNEPFGMDFDKANEYFEKAAQGGNPVGFRNLAMSYQQGRGVEPSFQKALEYFLQAAPQDPISGCEAAKIFLLGKEGEVEKNIDAALQLLAPIAGLAPEPSFWMGYALNELAHSENKYSWEAASDAFNLIHRAAQAQHPEAMFYVAHAYMEGRGVMANHALAKEWFEKLLQMQYRIPEVSQRLSQCFTGDPNKDLIPRYAYLYQIAKNNPERIKDKEPLQNEDGEVITLAAIKGAAQCGELNAKAMLEALEKGPAAQAAAPQQAPAAGIANPFADSRIATPFASTSTMHVNAAPQTSSEEKTSETPAAEDAPKAETSAPATEPAPAAESAPATEPSAPATEPSAPAAEPAPATEPAPAAEPEAKKEDKPSGISKFFKSIFGK